MRLHDKTILTTRAASQSAELSDRLRDLGARVLECPTIEIAPPDDWSRVDEAIAHLAAYDWILFTSANAVEPFMKRLEPAGVVCGIPIATVGAATSSKLQQWNLTSALTPRDFRAEGLLEAFPEDLRNVRILFPRAEKAREMLPEELRKRGATVDVVTVYRTVKAASTVDLREILEKTAIDCVVFTSESTIRYLAESVDGDLSGLKAIPIAVIGPITRKAVESYGLQPTIEPQQATIPSLVEAIEKFLQ